MRFYEQMKKWFLKTSMGKRFRKGYETTALYTAKVPDFFWKNWHEIAKYGLDKRGLNKFCTNYPYPKTLEGILDIMKKDDQLDNDPAQLAGGFFYTITHPIQTLVAGFKDYLSRALAATYIND